MIARIAVYLALIGLSLLQAAYYQPRLPAVMASHFDAMGRPDGWVAKQDFFAWAILPTCIVAGLFGAGEAAIRALARWGPSQSPQEPLTAEQAAARQQVMRCGRDTIASFLFAMGTLSILLVLVMCQLVIVANLNPPALLRHAWLAMTAYLTAVVGLLVWMGLRMHKLDALLPPRELAPGLWFPAKRWGWGWGPPVKWQGWVFMAMWLAVLLAGVLALARSEPTAWRIAIMLAFVAAMSAIMIAVCAIKGEKLRWRWGE